MPKPVRKMQKANAAAQAAVLPKIPPELLDQLVKGPMTAEAVEDASQAVKKGLIERLRGVLDCPSSYRKCFSCSSCSFDLTWAGRGRLRRPMSAGRGFARHRRTSTSPPR